MNGIGKALGVVVLSIEVIAGAGQQLAAQNPVVTTWVNLPRNFDEANGGRRNNEITELTFLDVLVGGKIRVFYTTQGYVDPSPLEVFPGTLRPVDLPLIPDLSTMQGLWASGPVIRNMVANWSKVLDGAPLVYGKRGSLNGMAAKNAWLYVATTLRHDLADTMNYDWEWNGFSLLYGPADPDLSFNPPNRGKELYSAGTTATGPGMREAVPEGVWLAETAPEGGGVDQWAFVANYCGRHAAGFVLVQNVNDPANADVADRYMIPCFEILGDYAVLAGVGPLGPEVDRDYFSCPLDAAGFPDCDDGIDDVGGNKIRSVIVLTTDPLLPVNGGRTYVFIGMNTDPIHINSYSNPTPIDNAGRDDGKYDYVACVDITDMVKNLPANPPEGSDLWEYDDPLEWAARMRFLRLPPDVPAGWTISNPTPTLTPGHDWSWVIVPNPDWQEGEPLNAAEQIKGSGTVKAMAASAPIPATAGGVRQFLFVLSSDQGHEVVAENQTLHDGGWHVPHLYIVDLGFVDLHDQQALDDYAAGTVSTSLGKTIDRYRLNKIIKAEFPLFAGGEWGAVTVNSTIPGFPNAGVGAIGMTRVSGADEAAVGDYYPGEFQLDPTARTRMHFRRNTDLAGTTTDNRLYIGLQGETQDSDTNATFNEPPGGWLYRVGAVLVLAIDENGQPSYLKTLTVDQELPLHPYQVSSIDVLPNDSRWVLPLAGGVGRNVLLLGGLSGGDIEHLSDLAPQDRIILVEDR